MSKKKIAVVIVLLSLAVVIAAPLVGGNISGLVKLLDISPQGCQVDCPPVGKTFDFASQRTAEEKALFDQYAKNSWRQP